ILLMDEPFGALDPLTRAELQQEFKGLQGRLQKAVVLVTHDLREALFLGTNICLMQSGKIVALCSPQQFLRSPNSTVQAYVQVIPRLALSGFLLPAPWLGERADRLAIAALTLYALLPLVRNTYAGVAGVDSALRETARAMGLTDFQLLYQLELPLAASVILAGLRTATVICVGVATIAAAIGAGGLGELIFRGLAMVN